MTHADDEDEITCSRPACLETAICLEARSGLPLCLYHSNAVLTTNLRGPRKPKGHPALLPPTGDNPQ